MCACKVWGSVVTRMTFESKITFLTAEFVTEATKFVRL
jgi:hypothetical protein